MECIAYNYPDEPNENDKTRTELFYNNLQYWLPCKKCVKHYKEIIKENPVSEKLCCNTCLQKWVKDIKQKINSKTDIKINKKNIKINDKKFKVKNLNIYHSKTTK